jgi:hypothetical protein
MMRRYLIYLLVAITAVVLLCAGGAIGYEFFYAGTRIVVRNTGQEAMRDVTVHVTGRVYSLGDLAPGDSRTQKVSPTGESSAEIEFTDEGDRRVRLNADCYFEPGLGYRGRIDVEIRDGKIVAVKDEAKGLFY